MLTIAQAQQELQLAAQMNPGPWEQHSMVTAENARRIAEKVPGMDPDKAYIMGLLHDIGRRAGVTGMLHLIDGYNYMMQLDEPEVAVICLTHSFASQNIELCDALSLPTGACIMEKRFVDVALRHGVRDYTTKRWAGYLEHKKYFDTLCGCNIYTLLPGIVENSMGNFNV